MKFILLFILYLQLIIFNLDEVREIEAVLRTQNKIIVADIIRSVQELEKEKLVLV